jgi:ubiquinone/menaquinone biosynthesis C-methylase UbiE
MNPHPRTARRFRLALFVSLSAAATVLAAAPGRGQGQQATQDKAQAPAVDPKINEQFADPDVATFVKRFESESREIYARRDAIVATLGLKPGQAAADIGAGTGLFTRLMAAKVGKEGTVYAVDISAPFLRHIADEAKRLDQPQVKTVRAAQNRTNLPPGSIDLAFICDVFHHVEHPGPWLATIHTALRPGGRLVLIEFDRARAGASAFVKSHVRADREQILKQFVAAGFEPVPTPDAPALTENFFQAFRKAAPAKTPAP